MNIAIGIIIGLAGFVVGWVFAHETISKECDRLGSFYVGSKVYQCSRVVSKKGVE